MVSPGNHEANCDNGGTTNKSSGVAYTASICLVGQTNFTGYTNHWRMPGDVSGGQGNFWYSYDYGMAHFISLDTETDLGHGLVGPDEGSPEFSGPFGLMNQQINWLVNDLANVNRTSTPWVIAYGHRPFYASTSGICANCVTAFEDIFYQYGVDLYFSGHSHVYERMAPIYRNTVDPNGVNNPAATLYMLNGAAGHYDGLDKFSLPLKSYSRFAQATDYAWSMLQFHNCTHLTQLGINSTNNAVFDQVTLYKNRTCATAST